MPIDLPSQIARDIRQPVLGDSFGWEGLEPAPAKKSIVIHGTASEAPDEDGFVVAQYHVNQKGWGGVGVHFVCTKDSYPGKPQFGLPAGAHLQYVGDLLTWRAGTANQNPGRIHIEISGLFTPGHGVASEAQLRVVRAFIDYALAPNNVLPSLNYYNQVTWHNAVPDQNTECPGWQHPQFHEWFGYLQGGKEPSWWAPKPTPEPTPSPTPTPIPVTVVPEYQATWTPNPMTMPIARAGAVAVNVVTGEFLDNSKPHLTQGAKIEIGGSFKFHGTQFLRTKWATDNDKWIGIDSVYFQPNTGQPDGPVATTVVANPAVVPAPDLSKLTTFQLIRELFAQLMAKFLRKRA